MKERFALNLIVSLMLSIPAIATPTETKLDLFPFSKYLARPEFAAALLEANQKAYGYKSRVMFTKDDRTRTTSEKFHIIVVGKTPQNQSVEHWYKAEFYFTAINSGFQTNVSPVATAEISEKEFVEFDQ